MFTDMTSTLTQAIHGDVENLGIQIEQLNILTEWLQAHEDRERGHPLILVRKRVGAD